MSDTQYSREQLGAQVDALANTAREAWPEVAVVLLALKGAMQNNHVRELGKYIAPFVEVEIEQIVASRKTTTLRT